MSNQRTRSTIACLAAGTLTLVACSSEAPPAAFSLLDSAMLAAPKSGFACAVGSAFGRAGEPNYLIHADASAEFSGWAVDSSKQPPKTFSLVLNGARGYVVSAQTGVSRSDVAEALKAPGAANSGFALKVSTAGVAPGIYDVLMLIPEPSGQMQLCEAHQKVTVAR